MADYAIGSPTLELFAQSYNAYCSDEEVNVICTELGYSKNFKYNHGLDANNNLYVIPESSSKAGGMWLASPSSSGEDEILVVSWDGGIDWSEYNSESYGLRPVIA